MKDQNVGMRALFIIVNAGFADAAVEITRKCGAGGATVLNARGTGAAHKALMGIAVDYEKEMIISLVEYHVAAEIMKGIKEKLGLKSAANGICFTMPVENMTSINKIGLNEK